MAGNRKLTIDEFKKNCEIIRNATRVDHHAKDEERDRRIQRAKDDYAYFFEYYFPMYASSRCAWFHIFIAQMLLRTPMGRFLNDWFRGCAKSVHANMGWPLWLKINGQLRCMALVGANEVKAKLLLSDIQAQLMSNQRLIEDFGEQYSHGNWADGQFTTADGVHFNAIGIGQSPRGLRSEGNRPDYIVVDDVDSQELSNNPKRVRKLVDWVGDDLMGCFDGPRQRFVVSNNTPFVHQVITSLINEKIGDAKPIDHKRFYKACPTPGAITYQINHLWHRLRVNAVDEQGNASWPEKYTKEYWATIRQDRSLRSWLREYMNTPVVEGTVFKNDHIRWKKVLPLEKYDYLIVYADPSWKSSSQSDHKAVAFIGKTGREYHLIKIFNRVASISQMVRWMYDLSESADPHIRDSDKPMKLEVGASVTIHWWIEGILNQDYHLQEFEREGDLRGYQLPIRPDFRAKGDKQSRIEGMSPYYERGWFYHNEAEREDPDMKRHVEHTLAFEPGSKTPDDSLDAQEGGMYYAQRHTKAIGHDPITGGHPAHNNKKW